MRTLLLLAFFCCLITGCRELDYPQSFPIVFTEEVRNISSSGVELVGRIESLGSEQNILKYGFVWDMSPEPKLTSSQVIVSEKIDERIFSKTITNDMVEGNVYYVKAFIQTDKLIIYGSQKKFISKGSLPPTIHDFSPKAGLDGTEVIISGTDFSSKKEGNVVTIGGLTCEVISASDSLLKIKSPVTKLVGDYPLSISVAGRTTSAGQAYAMLGPRIKSISRSSGRVGDLLSMTGEYFDITDRASITFGPLEQRPYNSASPSVLSSNEIQCRVPDFPNTTGKMQIDGYINNVYKIFNSPFDFTILNSWSKVSNQTPLGAASGFSSATIDGHLYFVGGRLLYEFIPATGVWTQKASFPGSQRYHGAAFVLNNKLYYGFGEASFDGGYFGDLWRFDPATSAWEFVMNAPIQARSRMVSFVVNNKAYLGFGFSRAGSTGIYYDDLWQFDPATLGWTGVTSPFKNENRTLDPISFALSNKGYVIGLSGYEVWQFDPMTSNWEKKNNFTGEFGGPVTASETSAFVFSGTRYGEANRVFEYDVIRDRWIRRQTFSGSGRRSAVAAWMNGKIYFGTGGGYTDLWELTL